MSRHETEHDDTDVFDDDGHKVMIKIMMATRMVSWIIRILDKPSNVTFTQICAPSIH